MDTERDTSGQAMSAEQDPSGQAMPTDQDILGQGLTTEQDDYPNSPHTQLGNTTVLSAYPTSFLANSPEPMLEDMSGELESINMRGARGILSLEVEKNMLTFQTENDALVIDVLFLFAVNFTSEKFQPKAASLADSPNFIIPFDTAANETIFTLFYYQGPGKDKKFFAQSFRAQDNPKAREWVSYFRNYLRPGNGNKLLKFFLVSNPFGGGRKAPKLFETITKPMFQLAGIEYDLFETQHFQHGIELTRTTPNLSSYDAIVSIGGDGVFHEIVNGSLTREDWEEVVKVPFGVLPAGSANGVAVSLGFADFHLATLNIIRGNTQKYDVGALYCTNKGDQITYSILDGVTGFLSDVDDTADEFRWMGPFRLDVAAFIRALFLKKYRTRIHYLPDDRSSSNCVVNRDRSSRVTLEMDPKLNNPRPGPRPSIPNVIKGSNSVTDPIEERLTKSWVTVDGAFSMGVVTNVPFLSKELCISSSASTSNGSLSLIHNDKNISGFGFVTALLKEVMDPGKGKFLSNMKETQAHCVIIESLGLVSADRPATLKSQSSAHSQIIQDRLVTWDPMRPGSFRVDGEVLEGTTAIQVQVLPGLLNFICPAWR